MIDTVVHKELKKAFVIRIQMNSEDAAGHAQIDYLTDQCLQFRAVNEHLSRNNFHCTVTHSGQ